jgi:hypothetical protein
VIDAQLDGIKAIKHRINLIEERPKCQRPYSMSQIKLDEVNNQVQYQYMLPVCVSGSTPDKVRRIMAFLCRLQTHKQLNTE